ncbi:glycosyltransferase 61 family protein [Granulosicoccus sp. 3-233]|uniref:glycosyltransferase family 61 protein n=1 Tax=Granulosicoccus sp. 3-233 TaxID=3417969 RepID=UPI003D343AE0
MTAIRIDPEGTCDRATRELQKCLVDEGNRLARLQHHESALATLFRAYSLQPGASPVLHAIAPVYEAMGDTDAATACRRGVVPESAEIRYFDADSNKSRFVSARRASNCQHLTTHRSEHIKLQAPASNADPRSRPEFRVTQTESRGSFVSVMDNGAFWFDGFNTAVVDSRQKLLQEHVKGNAHLIAAIARQRPERSIQGTVCFLDARSSSIYYHWMMDVLPKLAVLAKAGIALDSIDYFVVCCHSDFQRNTLQHLGIPEDKLLAPWSDGLTRSRKLLVPFLKHDRGDHFYNGLGLGMAQWVPQWLKSAFINAAAPGNRLKLYISRAARGIRSPLQEERLISELQQRGIRSITLESMSVPEQARLLSAANLVVAPHGAGLSNIAFCQRGTTVVELFDNYVVPCYWALAELAELDYHAYFADKSTDQQANRKDQLRKVASLADRRNQSPDLDIDDLLVYLDGLMQTHSVAS